MVVFSVSSEARCSWSWKAESSSFRARGDGPMLMSLDREPGRIRRVAAEVGLVAVGAAGVVVGRAALDIGLRGTSAAEPSIWTSVNGGGEGRRGEGGAAIAMRAEVCRTCAICRFVCVSPGGSGGQLTVLTRWRV